MSLCDECIKPGACCKRMHLSKDKQAFTLWDDESVESQMKEWNLPFVSIEKIGTYTDEESKRTYSTHLFSCPKLDEKGRCSIYDDRPQLCRSYEAGSDKLCVMFKPEEKQP